MERYIVNAFSKKNSGGNKAGVVIQDAPLDWDKKLETARVLGYSETVFLSPSQRADYKLEYFTPMDEVPLCGHATIGAFSALHALGRIGGSDYTIETKTGILNVSVHEDGLIFMEQNRPAFYEEIAPELLEPCFQNLYIEKGLPVQIVSTGLKDILVPVGHPEHLEALSPNFEHIAEVSRKMGVVGLHVFSITDQGGVTAVCRNFAPLYGIDEESATGTSNCALACYLFRHGWRREQYVFEQGRNMNQVSQMIVRLDWEGDLIERVYVGGYGELERTL